ncbi:MAG TPA: class I SAM-dependent methyltransferase [Kiloniellaceae bacterium]|nr:class I SAM-dependent methyltransferase [Kiloniellaceae bacterium]HIP77181.1 class I SAM-dependent methyltransferase [Kiloniellaceae bacterium]
MKKEQSFWDRVAARYARSPIKDIGAYRQTLERTKAHLNPGDRVLEVGCGTGSTALLLAPDVTEITASDISARMIEIAKAKAEDEGVANVAFIHGAAAGKATGSAPFDAVLAFNLLHLLDDLPAAIGRVRDQLKPGGLFISKTSCLAEQSRLLPVLIFAMRLVGQAPYVRFLRLRELEDLIRGEGFEIVETDNHPSARPRRFIVARKA